MEVEIVPPSAFSLVLPPPTYQKYWVVRLSIGIPSWSDAFAVQIKIYIGCLCLYTYPCQEPSNISKEDIGFGQEFDVQLLHYLLS